MTRTLIALAVAACSLSISPALAQPPDHVQDRTDARTQALAGRAARAAAAHTAQPGPDPGDGSVTTLPHRNFREEPLPSPEVAAEAAGCASGTMLWRRDQGVELCAVLCDHDGDCAGGERCRVVQTRATGPHALELAEEAQTADDDDDTVRLCDPFWEEPGPAVGPAP